MSAQVLLNNITLSAGAQAALSCLTLSSASLGPPTLATFAQPLGLQLVPPAAGQRITLQDVTIQTDCPTVAQYQAYVCGLNMSFLTGAVEIQTPHWMYVHSWQSDSVSLRKVNITCAPSPAGATAAHAACLATAVDDGPSLLAAVSRLQLLGWPQGTAVAPTPAQQPHVLVLVTQSIQLTQADVAPYWPQGCSVSGLVTIAAVPADNVVFDWGDLTSTLYVQLGAYLTLSGFLMVNLATSYAAPVASDFHLAGPTQTEIFAIGRASSLLNAGSHTFGGPLSNASVLLTVQACTLVVAFDSFAALSFKRPSIYNYWVVKGALALSAADLAAKQTSVQGVIFDPNHLFWGDNFSTTWQWRNLTITNPLAYPPTTVQHGGYLALSFYDGTQHFVPPPAMFQAMSLTDVWLAVEHTLSSGAFLASVFGQTIIVCANMSGNAQAWDAQSSLYPWPTYAPFVVNASAPPLPSAGPAGSVEFEAAQALQAPMQTPPPPPPPRAVVHVVANITLPAILAFPTTLTTWAATTVCWDIQQAPALLVANTTAPLTIRRMSLMNLPPHAGANASGSDPTLRLVSLLWSFHTADADGSSTYNYSLIRLDTVTLVVPPAELQLFLTLATLPVTRSARAMQNAVLLQQVSSHGAGWIFYSNLTTLRWRGTDVNLTSTLPPACSDYTLMPALASYGALTAPASKGAFPAWAVGLTAGMSGAIVLAAALASLLVFARRRRDRRDAAALNVVAGGDSSVLIQCDEESCLAAKLLAERGADAFSGSFTASGDFNMIDSLDDGPRPSSRGTSGARVNPKALAQAFTDRDAGTCDEQLQISGVLGRGGHGVVYRGTWKGLPVAAKVMIVHEEKKEQARRQMLEAILSTSLSHPNIVNTYSYDLTRLVIATPAGLGNDSLALAHTQSNSSLGSFTGAATWQLLIVQELCSGGAMRAMIDGTALTLPTHNEASSVGTRAASNAIRTPNLEHVLQLALDVALGLEHLHSKNVVHSDINPNNVLLQAAVEPRAAGLTWVGKVADFGLSVAFDEGRSHASKVYAGTPFYIAPETQSHGHLSKASDVFAFGILLSEMMSGRSSKEAFDTPSSALPMAPSSTSPAQDSIRAASSLAAEDHETSCQSVLPASGSAPAAWTTEESDVVGVNSGSCTHMIAPADFASAAQASNSRSSATSPRAPLLGGGGGFYGAARTLPDLPPSCPPHYCELVADCLNPVASKRPTIESVCRRLSLLASSHVPGYKTANKTRSNSGSTHELASSGSNDAALKNITPRVRGVGRRASTPSLLGRVGSAVDPNGSICEDPRVGSAVGLSGVISEDQGTAGTIGGTAQE